MKAYAALALLLFPLLAGAENPDIQLRLLTHMQKAEGPGPGFACWGVVPDLTNTHPTRAFFVAGPLWRHGSGAWLEVMGGAFADETGYVDPAVDIRASFGAKWKFFVEGLHTLRSDRTVLVGQATLPVASRVRLGGEVEHHWSASGTKFVAGPRVEFLLSPKGKVKLATAYQFADDGPDVVRGYLVLNF